MATSPAWKSGAFTGSVHAVHPTAPEIQGLVPLPSARGLPCGIDLAIVAVPAAAVLSVVDDCAAAGVRRAGRRATLDVDGFYKDLDGATRAAELYFPDFGTPPREVAGMLVRAAWDDSLQRLMYGIEARLAWVPHVLEQRQGIPRLESHVQASIGRQDWFAEHYVGV